MANEIGRERYMRPHGPKSPYPRSLGSCFHVDSFHFYKTNDKEIEHTFNLLSSYMLRSRQNLLWGPADLLAKITSCTGVAVLAGGLPDSHPGSGHPTSSQLHERAL
jgi:hypothetical protein